MSADIPCPFRHNVRLENDIELADCGLLYKLLAESNEDSGSVFEVKRDACLACSRTLPAACDLVGGAFPSILNNAAEKKIEAASSKLSLGGQRAEILDIVSEEALREAHQARQTVTCDVVLWCSPYRSLKRSAIETVLRQDNAETLVHLVVPSFGEDMAKELGQFEGQNWQLVEEYADRANVRLHAIPEANSSLIAAHHLSTSLSSEFVALQHSEAVSFPNRIRTAIGELRRLGCDFVGSSISTLSGRVDIQSPSDGRILLPWPSLVFRRSSFIDLGGAAHQEDDAVYELLGRAHACGLRVSTLPWTSVELECEWKTSGIHDLDCYTTKQGLVRHHALDFPASRFSLDVVLPVYGQLEFVGPAIESIIDQDNAETIIHLIDDCGPDDVGALFRYWGTHPRVRLYRNQRNIGQYSSFNNVSDYFETEFVMVQDSDDISLPHRCSVSANLLQNSRADYFAATMSQFGTESELPNRRSRFPHRKQSAYFAMNPTACFRVAMFRELGGYANYGAHERNRCGLDSEFMNRAYYSGRRFAISTAIVTQRRVHPNAATQRADTGFGSALRDLAIEESRRRSLLLQSSQIDPRFFGGLGDYEHLTERVS